MKNKCGASLTLSLLSERRSIVENIAAERKSVALLLESSAQHMLLETKVEVMQLNEVIYPYYLFSKASGNDLYSRIVRKTINELQESGIVEKDSVLLKEGFWDSVQAGIGSFASGIDKILKKVKLKKEPKGWEEAQKVFAKMAEKEGNEVIKDLIDVIDDEVEMLETGLGSKSDDQKFPTNKHGNIFFSGLNTIASTYDTVFAATEKDPGEEGYMPPDVANELIRQLRIIVQKYMTDTEREKGGMYASFGAGDPDAGLKATATGEGAEKGDDLLKEEDEEEPKEGTDTGEEIDPDEEYEKIMSGKDSPVFQRMTSLKAPLIIAGTGAALGAMGWVANQPWFQDFVLEMLDIPKTTDVVGNPKGVMDQITTSYYEANPELKDLGSIKSGGGGFAQQTSRLLGLGSGDNLMGADASIGDLKAAALKAGGGDLDTGLKNLSQLTQGRGNPTKAFEWMKTAIDNPGELGVDNIDKEGSLWKLFKGGTKRAGGIASRAKFPGRDVFSVGIGNNLNKVVMKKVLKTVTKSVPRKVAGVAVRAGTASAASTVAMLTGAAPVLAGIGLSTVVAEV